MIFYIIVAAAQLNLNDLRKEKWLFEMASNGSGQKEQWYSFYQYFGKYQSLFSIFS